MEFISLDVSPAQMKNGKKGAVHRNDAGRRTAVYRLIRGGIRYQEGLIQEMNRLAGRP
jgi:hypothetical protein